jgi:hypothetical protein
MRHKPVGIGVVAGLHQTMHLVGFQGFPTHFQGIPLPFLVQHPIGQVPSMHLPLALRIPSPTRGDDRPMRIVLAIATLRLHDHHVAALEGFAADLAVHMG